MLRDTDVRLQEEKSIRGNLYYVLEETMAKLTESLNEEKVNSSLLFIETKYSNNDIFRVHHCARCKPNAMERYC